MLWGLLRSLPIRPTSLRYMDDVSRVGAVVAELGECPAWNPDEQLLYWEDIEGRALHRTNPDTGETETRELPGRPGAFVFTQTPGRLLVATESALEWFDWETGSMDHFVAVEDPARGNRLNDGRCDHAGRFVVGTMNPDPALQRFDGSLYSINADGRVDTLEDEVGIPNSTVFDADRGRMYWADTFRSTIWKWDYDLDTGRRSNKAVFFDYSAHPDVDGLPDGACLDAEGCLWSASVTGWGLTRLTPDGAVERRIELPVSMPTMPAFGGPDLSTIFVTSLVGGPKDPDRSRGVPAGALLAVDVDVCGVPEPRFAR